MSLKTKSIKSPRSVHDGLRISVMSRHTLNDGITPDPEIGSASFDEWWPELAPRPSLIGAYYKRGLLWDVFEKKFRKYLSLPRQKEVLEKLVALSRTSHVTILCIEPTPEHCHRRLIAEICRGMDPLLKVSIE